MERTIELATEMADSPPLALRVSKRVLQHNVECDLRTALRCELTSLVVRQPGGERSQGVTGGISGEAEAEIHWNVRRVGQASFGK